ncbi:MAG: hypothetical protein AAB462_00370 [Patescibacteria group bacterium]
MPTQEQTSPQPALQEAEASQRQVPAHLQEFTGDIALPDNLSEAGADNTQEKLTKVLGQATELLDVAKKHLSESGQTTGNRRDDEEAVTAEAANMAVEAALEADDEQGSVEAMEALVAVHLLGSGYTRAPFRQAVCEGLGDSLVTALQSTKDLTIKYSSVADNLGANSLHPITGLLGMATGKQLDADFNVTGVYDMKTMESYPGYDEALDVLAAVSATPDKERQLEGVELISNWGFSKLLKQQLSSGTDPNKMKEFYKVAEAAGDGYKAQDLLKYDNPAAVLEIAQKYGIEDWEAQSFFGTEGETGLYFIDQQKVDTYNKLNEMFEQAGVKQADLDGNLSEFYSSRLKDMIDGVVARGVRPEEYVEDAVTNIELKSAYKRAFGEISYPIEAAKETFAKIDFSEVPMIGSRLAKLGLSPELSKDMFEAWGTYQAYANRAFEGGNSDDLPQEAPDEQTMSSIVDKQAEAIKYNLESLESFAEEYGVETMQQVIDNFGIRNFARYKAPELIEQNERWLSGDGAAKSVVVNARSDWNSYVGKGAIFEKTDQEGRFIFEAGSGAEVAKVAVRVGQRERVAGRQPNVSDFIVHAHGSPNVMVMGPNGESIDTKAYHEAALKRQKLHNTELNDYKKHLGENFQLILYSCSTAGESDEAGTDNMAETMSEAHDTKVLASDVTVSGLTIKADGSVEFKTDESDGQPVIYE